MMCGQCSAAFHALLQLTPSTRLSKAAQKSCSSSTSFSAYSKKLEPGEQAAYIQTAVRATHLPACSPG
jgi:hypothetical protein